MSGTSDLAYLRWHLRDALPRAVVPLLVFLGIGGIPLWSLIGREGLASAREAGRFQDVLLQLYGQTLTLAITLGALVLLSGVVSVDRERGHVRFLFASPVVAWRHYLARAVVSLVLFAAALALIPLGFGAVVVAVPVLPVIGAALLYGLLLGSLGLLAGAITDRDGPVVIVTVLLSAILQPLAAAGQLPSWAARLAQLLPPLASADAVRSAWLAGTAPSPGHLWLVLGYSFGMAVAAFVVIHRAPLVR